jgi:HAD superfamily phosphatase (TIGR01668 family)
VDSSEDSGDNLPPPDRFLVPDLAVRGLCDVPLERLRAWGIRGIIVDLDNTLVEYAGRRLAPEVNAWVEDALAADFRIVLLSNNFAERVAAIGSDLGVPTVSSALKPLPNGFLRALRVLGTTRKQTVVIGDQLFTDVLGAKCVGLRAILTEPLVDNDFPLTRVLRWLERVVVRRNGR